MSDDRAKGKNPYDRPSDPAKRHSAAMTDGPDRAPARAMLKAIGFTDEDLAKPIIGVATTWIETMPCNYNQRATNRQRISRQRIRCMRAARASHSGPCCREFRCKAEMETYA